MSLNLLSGSKVILISKCIKLLIKYYPFMITFEFEKYDEKIAASTTAKFFKSGMHLFPASIISLVD